MCYSTAVTKIFICGKYGWDTVEGNKLICAILLAFETYRENSNYKVCGISWCLLAHIDTVKRENNNLGSQKGRRSLIPLSNAPRLISSLILIIAEGFRKIIISSSTLVHYFTLGSIGNMFIGW